MLNRRHFYIGAAAAAPLFTAGRLYAAPATGPAPAGGVPARRL